MLLGRPRRGRAGEGAQTIFLVVNYYLINVHSNEMLCFIIALETLYEEDNLH
jgi:hypothetical protein